MQLPKSTADVTAEFVTQALHAGCVIPSEVRVQSVTVEPIGEGVGVAGQLARLHVAYDDAAVHAPHSFVLKLPSQFAENRAVGEAFRFYEREGRMYQRVLPGVPCRVPRAFWNHVDPASGEYGLLLEDMSDRSGADQVAGIDIERARLAVRTLAVLHAAWWDSPRLADLAWLPRIDDPVYLAAGEHYRQAWPRFLELFGSELSDVAVAIGERVQEQLEAFFLLAATYPLTIAHGDFRADNLMFDLHAAPEEQVAVLDWQISGRAPGASDIAYFLCQSMTVADRRRYEPELFQQWYADIAVRVSGTASIPSYPVEDATRDFRRAALATTVFPVVAGGRMDPANERGRRLVSLMAERAFAAAADHDGPELYPSVRTADEALVPRQRLAVHDTVIDLDDRERQIR